jgi:hypothetical protein
VIDEEQEQEREQKREKKGCLLEETAFQYSPSYFHFVMDFLCV